MSEITNLIETFNWHSPSWDLFILLAWVAVSMIYAFTAGRGRIINILMSVYIAKLLVVEAPFITRQLEEKLPDSVSSIQQLITFGVLFLVLFIFLGRYAFRTSADSRNFGSIAFGLVFSFLQIGLLINIILTFLPGGVQESFTPLIRLVFIDNPANFVWLLVPLVYLIILGKYITDPNEL